MDKKKLAITEVEVCIEMCYDLYRKDMADSEILNIVNKLKRVAELLGNE